MMPGKVYLIGAGPGDYKLLTLKALECLQSADVIVYDRLASQAYLKEAKAGCELINVGKASSNHTLPQEAINEVIARKAKEGKIVARLKGGDPYVFGRGGEEGEYLFDQGVNFEVVPGVTSAIGGLCYAGIPITHRDFASSFHVMTGHLKDEEKDEINWKALAGMKGTLVFLMGVANLQKITSKLLEEGKSKETPVALISWATRYNQSVVTGTLEDIYEKAMAKGVKPPTLIVIGEVVGLRNKLNFFENKPLFGKTVVVTRTRKKNSQLAEHIRDQGGHVIEMPTLEIKEIEDNTRLEEAIRNIKAYSYLVFTSQNAVDIFFNKMTQMHLDTRILGHTRIVAIGTATEARLKEKGILADLKPKEAVGEALCECLQEVLKKDDHILLPHSAIARDCIKVQLEKICKVDEIAIYDTVLPSQSEEEISKEKLLELLKNQQVDYITFTSSSTVKHLVQIIGEENLYHLGATKLISIGKITSKTIRDYGLQVYEEAKQATTLEMINCMCKEEENKDVK